MSIKKPYKNVKSREKPKTVVFAVPNYNWTVKNKLPLYSLVYGSKISFLTACFLFASFLIQGAPLARASDITELPLQTNIAEVVDTNGVGDFDVAEVDEISEITVEDIFVENDNVESFDNSIHDQVMPDSVNEVQNNENDSELGEDEISDTENEIKDSFLDDESVELVDDEMQGEETQTEDYSDDIYITEENATSSEVVAQVVAVAYSDNSFSFNEDECTKLASGSFYCNKVTENTLKDALFAAPDSDGDLEIFLVRDGIETQVTQNLTDDAAPFYDKNSNTIVWHRLVNDRYQIVSYDIDSDVEEVLTDTAENNMEPNRQGKYTVWQRWVNGGWNIVLSDGRHETQLTKTTSHNVAPYIHGNLVVWNRHDQVNERTIEMYDLSTETYVSIEDPDGMSVSNPRMVFVYDSILANGDIVTKGYDMLAKKFIDLDTLPRDLPEELPNTDSTGETRALLQSKTSGKSEVDEIIELENGTTTSSGTAVVSGNEVVNTATSTTPLVSSELTLDLSTTTVKLETPAVKEPVDLDLSVSEQSLGDLSELLDVVEFVIPE